MTSRHNLDMETRGDVAGAAVRRRAGDLAWVGAFSTAVNLLTLTGSIYMLQVYDRVLISRSVETLLVLSMLALLALALQGALDVLRARMLSRIGAQIDADLSPAVFRAATLLPLAGASAGEALLPARDADQLKSFLGGSGPGAFFDVPFIPIFVAGCFLLHPWLGWAAVGGAAAIVGLTALAELAVRKRARDASAIGMKRQVYVDAARRHAEAIGAMGMGAAMLARWRLLSDAARNAALGANDVQADLGGVARIFRIVLQSGILGLGAYLAIRQEISGGAMIAASILASRALAPIEVAIANWRGFVAARQAYARLKISLLPPAPAAAVALPPPVRSLQVEAVTVAAPGRAEPILRGASLDLVAGSGLAIVGPSGAGKSSLARAIVGIWPVQRGEIRLDGASLSQWDRESLGPHIGYLPQDLALPDGTIAETIARFSLNGSSDAVIRAAKAAGVRGLHYTDSLDKLGSVSFTSGGPPETVAWDFMFGSEFIGAGPRIGMEGSTRIGNSNFGISGMLAGAVIHGLERTSGTVSVSYSGGTITPPFPSEEEWKTVLDVEAALGLDYYLAEQTKLTLGYRAEQLFNVSSSSFYASGGSPHRLVHGPFLKAVSEF